MNKIGIVALVVTILFSTAGVSFALGIWSDTQEMQQKIEITITGSVQGQINLPALSPGESTTFTKSDVQSFENALTVNLVEGEKFLVVETENFNRVYSDYNFMLFLEDAPSDSSLSPGTGFNIGSTVEEIPLIASGEYVFSYMMEVTAKDVSEATTENIGINFSIQNP